MEWNTYLKAVGKVLEDYQSTEAYLFVNKVASKHAERAMQTFNINANQYENPVHQLEVVRVCLQECSDELYNCWKYGFAPNILPPEIKNELVFGSSFVRLTQITSAYYKHEEISSRTYEIQANAEKRNAIRVASSKITGLGFGIISNSIASHLIYLMQSEAAIKRQVRAAKEYVEREKIIIERKMGRQIEAANRMYYSTEYAPAARKCIEQCFSEVVVLSILALGKRKLVDVAQIQSFDYEKSQEVLAKIEFADKPELVIEESLKYCPYNVHAYAEAKKRSVFNDNLEMAMKLLDLNEAVDKEVAFSLLDSDDFIEGFTAVISKNQIDRNEDEWQRIALKHLEQSRDIIKKHSESFAGYGAVATYLVAANMESNQTAFWTEVNTNLAEFVNRYSPSEAREKCFKAILDKFSAYITEYFHYSVEYFLNEAGWDYASATKRWQKTASDKRRLIPAIHCFTTLIDSLKKQLPDEKLIAELNNDLLWCLVMFCKPHFAADSAPSGGILRKYYHIPLAERQFAIDLFDGLLNSPYATANGRFTTNKQKSPRYIEEVFAQYKNEVTEEGKVFFGMKKPEPMPQGTKSSAQSSGGCYIATCVYGSYDCPQVWTLRRFRDDILQTSIVGRTFVRCYYTISPVLVKWFGKASWFRRMWKYPLDRLVTTLQNYGIDNSAYSDRE